VFFLLIYGPSRQMMVDKGFKYNGCGFCSNTTDFFMSQKRRNNEGISGIPQLLYKKSNTPPHTKALNLTPQTKETKLFQTYLYLTIRTSNFYSYQ